MSLAQTWTDFFKKIGRARLASMRRPLVIVDFDGRFIARHSFKPCPRNDNRRLYESS